MAVELSRPRTLMGALEELTNDDMLVLAGGQSLVLLMNLGMLSPQKLVSISALAELQGVFVRDTALDIGALCTHNALANDANLVGYFPTAAEMFSGIGNIRVRVAGTLGGSLVHADPAQDAAVMLAVLRATAVVVGLEGERRVPIEDLANGPFSVSLRFNEILTRVEIPLPIPNSRSSYQKYLPGSHDDYATVSVAASVATNPRGRVTEARLAAGAVGPTVVLLEEAADVIIGRQLEDEDALALVQEAVERGVSPDSDHRGSADYKREMAGIVAVRALRACMGRRTSVGVPFDQGSAT